MPARPPPKSTTIIDNTLTPDASAAATAPAPTASAKSAPVIGALPSAFDPRALAALADARDKLKAAEGALEQATQAKRLADERHDGARASLDLARKRALDAATSLLGTDLADNILTISDDEAARLQKDANDAKRALEVHVRAKLFS